MTSFCCLESLTSNHSSFRPLFSAFLSLREELRRWLRVFSAATKGWFLTNVANHLVETHVYHFFSTSLAFGL
uniref:Uncharacterized protein n=1 Tax=Nelumbo nucifera TaxID=4432 RepID=A0A822Y222_NELNU|nr:TPA_asm: hypothetical protein HUJ06_027965 [Nelumbo nucifera]